MAQVSELLMALEVLFPTGEGFLNGADHDIIYLRSEPEPDEAIKAGIAQPFDPDYPDEPYICLVECTGCLWSDEHDSWVMYC